METGVPARVFGIRQNREEVGGMNAKKGSRIEAFEVYQCKIGSRGQEQGVIAVLSLWHYSLAQLEIGKWRGGEKKE